MAMSPRLGQLLKCWSCSGCESQNVQAELQVPCKVQLNADLGEGHQKVQHALTSRDSFDLTFVPHSCGLPVAPMTPRQRDVLGHLDLPDLVLYPLPPNSHPDDPEEERKRKLLDMYQEFALSLHTGLYLTQLTSSRDYSDIHCQLMEDMLTLKLDQSNGRIIEFPLTNVSKVYRIVKTEDRWYTAGMPLPNGEPSQNIEQIVVVEFMRRKLAFVFKDLQEAQRFLISMELLIRRAQQKQAGKACRSLTPAFPPPQPGPTNPCPTPRQVHDIVARPWLSYLNPAARSNGA